MAGISAYAEKAMLDWSLGGAVPVRPAQWSVNLSLGAPTSVAASEIATGSGVTRQAATFAAAASPAGSASNSNAMTFGPFSAACTVSSLVISDTAAAIGGNLLYFGPLATPRTMATGDVLTFAVGQITIALA